MAPSSKQIDLAKEIGNYISSFANSNDLQSPTNPSDIEEKVLQLQEDFDLDETQTSTVYDCIFEAYWLIRSLK